MTYDSRADTYEHIGKVQDLLGQVIEDLLERMAARQVEARAAGA